jgi:serine/threonine-protein kinase
MIGEVFGNYRIIAKLGEGGMGAVYLAEHPSIGRKVAVKMIRPDFSNDAETLRRFVREARSTATLRHPSLVDIMDYGVHEKTGSAYIIMEYLEGESLDACLERRGRLEIVRAAHIARQIALGMAAAHRAGIIHRDLKPGNVHLGTDPDRPGVDVVKVLDFGIAKLATNDTGAGPTTRTDVLLGTPRYMAPEQCRGGGALDHRADIYALGCLFYETLCGRPPFPYQWPGELIAAHLGEMPMPPRTLVPAIPAPLDALVMRAIAKNPDHRPQTMSDVARELEAFLGVDVSMPPIAIAESAAPPQAHGAPGNAEGIDRGARGAAATTTASAVIRPTPVGVGGGTPGAELHHLGPGPSAPLSVEARAEYGLPRRGALLRAALIGGGSLAALVGLVAAFTAKKETASIAVEPSSTPSAVVAVAVPAATEAPQVEVPTSTPPASPPEEGPTTPEGLPVAAPEALSVATTAPTAATAPEPAPGAIRIRVSNTRPGLRVTVDGRVTSLPVRLPRDQKAHVLVFAAPNFRPETKTILADQDHILTLEYRPKLYVP